MLLDRPFGENGIKPESEGSAQSVSDAERKVQILGVAKIPLPRIKRTIPVKASIKPRV